MSKTLHNSDASGAAKNVPDITFFGNGDLWQLICKASSENEGWMKSTKAMEIPGVGCIVQVTTQQENSQIIRVEDSLPFGIGSTSLGSDIDLEDEDGDTEEHEDIEDIEDDEDEYEDGGEEIIETAKNGSYSITDSVTFIPGVMIQILTHKGNLEGRRLVPIYDSQGEKSPKNLEVSELEGEPEFSQWVKRIKKEYARNLSMQIRS